MSIRTQAALKLRGRFWESNFDSRPIADPLALVTRIAYDHRNPVKQHMVARPEEFLWSTAAEWESGVVGPLPIVLHSDLPFSLSFEQLRCEVLRYQRSPRLDEVSESIAALLRGDSGDTARELEELLAERGLPWTGFRA